MGAVIKAEIQGADRFSETQAFINSCLSRMIVAGNLDQPFSGPHFFCSFSFSVDGSQNGFSYPDATVLLPVWQIARHNWGCVIVVNLLISAEINLERLTEQTWQRLQGICTLPSHAGLNSVSPKPDNIQISRNDIASFKASVSSVLRAINNHQLHKIVLAHAIEVTAPQPFCLTQSLDCLRQRYPACHIFSVDHGQGITFMGASPERLLRISDRHLTTDALAGSAPRGNTAVEDIELANGLLDSPKELHEHQVVLEFITQRLIQLGLAPQLSRQPQLLRLSNIQHLWTPIQAIVPSKMSPLEIVATLHPTPAVAGAPREIACEHIRHYENFGRSLYAAPLGWIDHRANGEFIVGIRSALIRGCWAKLYAGAGIVAGSNPNKEFAEIELKLQALLEALA